jgi:hypothetical protein
MEIACWSYFRQLISPEESFREIQRSAGFSPNAKTPRKPAVGASRKNIFFQWLVSFGCAHGMPYPNSHSSGHPAIGPAGIYDRHTSGEDRMNTSVSLQTQPVALAVCLLLSAGAQANCASQTGSDCFDLSVSAIPAVEAIPVLLAVTAPPAEEQRGGDVIGATTSVDSDTNRDAYAPAGRASFYSRYGIGGLGGGFGGGFGR